MQKTSRLACKDVFHLHVPHIFNVKAASAIRKKPVKLHFADVVLRALNLVLSWDSQSESLAN